MTSEEDNKNRRPAESDFHQQRLPSWNPLILISTVWPLFGSIGVIFLFIGVILILTTINISEHKIDYTMCKEYNKSTETFSNRSCAEVLNKNYTSNYEACTCRMDFTLPKEFKGQVYFYYALTNFYQNHRKYFSSRDDSQLLGRPIKTVSSSCKPFDSVTNGSLVLNYAPCGAIANSLFNDTFQLFFVNQSNRQNVNMSSKGIAWNTDVYLLSGKPKDWTNTLKPINWKYTAEERNKDSYTGDEELLVWMRTASLSSFKKLNRIISHDREPFLSGLPSGDFQLLINYAYPVVIYGGTKTVVLSTTNALGGKNNNMGIMYLTLGSIHELIALCFFMFTILNKNKKKSFSDTPLIILQSTPENYGTKDELCGDGVRKTRKQVEAEQSGYLETENSSDKN